MRTSNRLSDKEYENLSLEYEQNPPLLSGQPGFISHMRIPYESLVSEIANAARKSFQQLFATGESFYYCALITTGEAHCPHVTAWSYEALERTALERSTQDPNIYGNHEQAKAIIKWMYAESPYVAYNYEENFTNAAALFQSLPTPFDAYMAGDEAESETRYNFRLSAMEEALKQLDREGLFAQNQPRSQVYVNVETVYPDYTDKARALRLNNPDHLSTWFEEAGQYIEGPPQQLITYQLRILNVGENKKEVMKLLRKSRNIPLAEITAIISNPPIFINSGPESDMLNLKQEYEKAGCTVSIERC